MIVKVDTMKKCEQDSNFSCEELMEQVGRKLAIELIKRHAAHEKMVFCCGPGNNGGDGFVAARYLLNQGYTVSVLSIKNKQKTKESHKNKSLLDKSVFITNDVKEEMESCDVLVDAIFGFGFTGIITDEYKEICCLFNQSSATKYSIDINSGAEADSGRVALNACVSDTTFALGYKKIIHECRKDHFLFNECIIIPLDIPAVIRSNIIEMNDECFCKSFPFLKEDAYKGILGKPLIIGGGMGMVGATALNILGAKASGASYIHVACVEDIYPLLASREITPVFHPFTKITVAAVIKPLLSKVQCVCFGSGAVFLESKKQILELVLQQSHCPVVLDAEAIRCLIGNLYILKLLSTPVICTPHLQEFSDLLGIPIEVLKENKLELAINFAREYHVFLVLKGPHTLVVSPMGEVYINQTGNAGLAKAGSGDFLAGLITGFISQKKDLLTSIVMAVWLHGKAADEAIKKHHINMIQVENLYEEIDNYYKQNC